MTKARKSIATYKLRDGMAIGAKVTLRGDRMYEFLDRFVTIALPRVKDFRGLNPKSFDGRGNFACGLKEHIVFPEIDYDKVDEIWGMDVIVCTSAEATTTRPASCSAASISRSAARGPRAQPERPLEDDEWPRQSSVEKNNRRRKLVGAVRGQAQAAQGDRRRSQEAGGGALCGAAQACRDAAQLARPTRIRNRCEITGRARGYYRKLRLCRNQLRELASQGLIPGMVEVELVREGSDTWQ